MSGQEMNINNVISGSADYLTKELGRDSFCLKNCIDITESRMKSRETECFDNCVSVYKKFQNSYETNVQLLK
jgi:hypothetical protein